MTNLRGDVAELSVPVGSGRPSRVTSRNTLTASTVGAGRARIELHAVEIFVPPRNRSEEVSEFASFFLDRFNRQYGRAVQLGPEVIAALRERSWPGNLLELEETVHQLVAGRGGRFSRQ